MLKLDMLSYFTMFQFTICEFPVRKERFFPPGAKDARSLTARSAVF